MHEDVLKVIGGRSPNLFKRSIVFAGSFDPLANHHLEIVRRLTSLRTALMAAEPGIPVEIVIWPVGAYDGKQQIAEPTHRKTMLSLGLEMLLAEHEGSIVTTDLDRKIGYTSTYQMQTALVFEPRTDLHAEYFSPLSMPGTLREIWHVIGADNVDKIPFWNEGHELWEKGRFIVIARDGFTPKEYPKHSVVLDGLASGSSQGIRQLITEGKAWGHLVPASIADYIVEHRLYGYEPQMASA